MKCTQCGRQRMASARVTHLLTVAEHTFQGMVAAKRCAACGQELLEAKSLRLFEQSAAQVLAVSGECGSGDAMRFVRKVLGLRAIDLAELLGVAPETVSRWENGQREAERSVVEVLASMVIDKGAGRSDTIDRLRQLQKPKKLPKVIAIGKRAA